MAKATPAVDLSEFAELAAPIGRRSPIDAFVSTLSASDRAKLDAACQSPSITSATIARWLASKGAPGKVVSLAKWVTTNRGTR